MVFSSLIFLFVFLPLVIGIYYISPKSMRNLLLFVASLIFYAWGEPVYVVIMLFSTLVDYTNGILVDHYLNQNKIIQARIALFISVFINLSLLGFFKYTDFVIQTVNSVTGMGLPLLQLTLPIGISFYTFQTMSYTIDVYRRQTTVQKNIISFGAYVTLFPQLIAGPIVQYKTIAAQLDHRIETVSDFSEGIHRFVIGLGKKVLLANNIGLLWSEISASNISQLPVLTAWLGIIAFSFQIYFDFSGYSDMAIGLGKMFGFHFLENFNYPYMSKSITDFWRRWHISLGTWFREYVYFPMGGNRVNRPRLIFNLFIVWFLTGFWHGASWNFIFWGLYFCGFLIFEKFIGIKWLSKLPSFISHVYALIVIVVGWVIFSFTDLNTLGHYLQALFGLSGNGIANTDTLYYLSTNWILLIIVALGSTSFPALLGKKLTPWLKAPWLLGIFILSIAFLVNATYNPFLYFRF